eukprot:6487205-Amphidinium_carterae.1
MADPSMINVWPEAPNLSQRDAAGHSSGQSRGGVRPWVNMISVTSGGQEVTATYTVCRRPCHDVMMCATPIWEAGSPTGRGGGSGMQAGKGN